MRSYISVKSVGKFVLRGSVAFLVISAVFIGLQDFVLFPGAVDGLLPWHDNSPPAKLPNGVTAHMVKTSDGEQLEVWELAAPDTAPPSPFTMLFFHGNAGDVQNFFPYQQWARSLHFRSFDFDYRGYGRSSGWPSEQGLYQDADAMAAFLEEKGIEQKHLILVGISIGSGPASYLANKISPRALVLFTPYTSIPDVARGMPLFGVWHSFVWNEFPVRTYLRESKTPCVILAHGRKDMTIPYTHSETIMSDHFGNSDFQLISADESGHNDVLFKTHSQVAAALTECLK